MKLEELGKPTDQIVVSTRMLQFASKDIFLMTAKGKNMEPSIRNHDLLLCALNYPTKTNDIVVLWNGTDAEVKFKGHSAKLGIFYHNAKMEIFDKIGFKEIAKVESIFNRKL